MQLKLQAQPIEGKANEALIKYSSGELGVPKSALTITHGLTSTRKLVEVVSATLTPEQAAQILLK
ncbi:DUF167 domain-containing protein [Massilia violaceinigra]|uniref:DUF167 domain-containing protein n=1 Tax=Massilia violaceinigra TaxID=2045208 RepID=UPI001E41859F|nr:DUF167 domain-containing protein [Massilia violaceinigra]